MPPQGHANTFGKYLREKRVEAGFTLRRFAEMMDVSPTYLSGVETGSNPVPTITKLRIVSDKLGIPLDELLERAERLGSEAQEIVKDRPEMVRLLRATQHLSPNQVNDVISRLPKPDRMDDES